MTTVFMHNTTQSPISPAIVEKEQTSFEKSVAYFKYTLIIAGVFLIFFLLDLSSIAKDYQLFFLPLSFILCIAALYEASNCAGRSAVEIIGRGLGRRTPPQRSALAMQSREGKLANLSLLNQDLAIGFDSDTTQPLYITTRQLTEEWLGISAAINHTYNFNHLLVTQIIAQGVSGAVILDGDGESSNIAMVSEIATRFRRDDDLRLLDMKQPLSRFSPFSSQAEATNLKLDRLLLAIDHQYKLGAKEREMLAAALELLNQIGNEYNLSDLNVVLGKFELCSASLKEALPKNFQSEEAFITYSNLYSHSSSKGIAALLLDAIDQVLNQATSPLIHPYGPDLSFRSSLRRGRIICVSLADSENSKALLKLVLSDLIVASRNLKIKPYLVSYSLSTTLELLLEEYANFLKEERVAVITQQSEKLNISLDQESGVCRLVQKNSFRRFEPLVFEAEAAQPDWRGRFRRRVRARRYGLNLAKKVILENESS